MKFFVRPEWGTYPPRLYGFCWHDYLRNESVCCPVPFNLILRLARAGWYWLLRPMKFCDREFVIQHYKAKADSLDWELWRLKR